MSILIRLYSLPLRPIALLSVGNGRIRAERTMADEDPLLPTIVGPVTADSVAVLREALRTERYVVSRHDPDDGFFRANDRMGIDEFLAAARATSSAGP